jgi:multisubunit Na+/H+ antiporter MnhE subunit
MLDGMQMRIHHYNPFWGISDWLEIPGALILLIVSAPSLLASDLRDSVIGYIISLVIGIYFLQEHIRVAGGFRNAFAERRGVANTIGIILLFACPLWELIKAFL